MATFGDVERFITQYMNELPEGQFAEDRADAEDPTKNSLSSSDIRAQCLLLADASANLQQIYNNKFATSADAIGLQALENDWFPYPVDTALPIDERRARLKAKMQTKGVLSLPGIRKSIKPLFDAEALAFDIAAWSGMNGGAWILGESLLGVDTFLALLDPLRGAGGDHPLDCDLDYAAAGLTAQELADIQTTAYTYEVRVYGHASAGLLAKVDRQLTEIEPARSTHVILNDFPVPS